MNQNPLQGHLWSYSMEALNKESEFATLHVMFQCPWITLHEFLCGDENAHQLRLDQETVSALLKSMDTEYDRSILRAIIALLHTRSDPTLARRKIKEVIEVAVECRMSIVAGKDIVNLRLKDRLRRIDAEIEEKKTVLEKNEKPGRYRVQLFKYVGKTATQVLKQQFLKAYPCPLICIFKKHPPFFIDFENFAPPL